MDWGPILIAFIGGTGLTKLVEYAYKAIWGKKIRALGNQATEVDIVEKYRKMILDTDVLVDELRDQNNKHRLREIQHLNTISDLALENKELKEKLNG